MGRSIKLFLATSFCISFAVQASEPASCDKIAELNDEHIKSLAVGMSKEDVLSIMSIASCPESQSPVKVQSFKVDSSVVEVLWYVSTKEPRLTPLIFKDGKYGGNKIGYITSPNSGS